MIEIPELMSNNDLQQLMSAIEHDTDYTFNKNGLAIEITNDEDGWHCHLNYAEPTQKEVGEFTEYCESLDDEIFVGICEYIGHDGLNRIQDCLDSDNIESVRSAIQFFKNNAKDYVNNKIKEYEDVLKTL